jgi:hypothetical protein
MDDSLFSLDPFGKPQLFLDFVSTRTTLCCDVSVIIDWPTRTTTLDVCGIFIFCGNTFEQFVCVFEKL